MELKRDFPGGRPGNTKLAKEAASLAVDGGLLILGVDEDDAGRAATVCGTDLNGLAERVDATIRSNTHPPLFVRIHPPISDPDNSGRGCLLVEVPPSGQAPHQVDGVYYGRNERGKMPLPDDRVRELILRRAAAQDTTKTQLHDMVSNFPQLPEKRKAGHLFLIANPLDADPEAMIPVRTGAEGQNKLHQAIEDAIGAVPSTLRYAPTLISYCHGWRPQHNGLAFTSLAGVGETSEGHIMLTTIRDDGGIEVTCGEGAPQSKQPWQESMIKTIAGSAVLRLTHSVAALAAILADKYTGYQGRWHLGLCLDDIRGAIAWEVLRGRNQDPYTRDFYEHIVTASSAGLADDPAAVVERLSARLLRALGIDSRYLPYREYCENGRVVPRIGA